MSILATRIGAIAIGRNEGPRLKRCLSALTARLDRVVYVDSGSTDDSLAIAGELGVHIVHLDTTIPFTAGRARNSGFQYLLKSYPDLELVQFIDGDCELVDGWLEAGLSELECRPDVAVVCGRRRELDPQASIYNRLVDLEWETPIGEAAATGGDFLIRTNCFRSLGGFDTAVVAGEEPELGFRIRRIGWKIARIDQEMTRHDAAITSILSWWRRERRAGYGGIDVLSRTAGDSQSYFQRQVRSAWGWTFGWLTAVAIFSTMGAGLIGLTGVVSGAFFGIATLLIQIARISKHYRRADLSRFDSMRLAMLTCLGKWPQMIGQIKWNIDRCLGRRAVLIEYKATSNIERPVVSS